MRTLTNLVACLVLALMATDAVAHDADEPNAALRYWRAWAVIGEEDMERFRDINIEDIGEVGWKPDWGDQGPPCVVEPGCDESAWFELTRAIETAQCNFGIDYEDGFLTGLPHLGMLHLTKKVLAIRAHNLLQRDEFEGAALQVERLLRVTHHTASNRSAISSFVGYSCMRTAERLVERLIKDSELDGQVIQDMRDQLDTFEADDPVQFSRAVEHTEQANVRWLRNQLERPVEERNIEVIHEISAFGFRDDGAVPASEWFATATVEEMHEALDEYSQYIGAMLDLWDGDDAASRLEKQFDDAAAGTYGRIAEALPLSYGRYRKAQDDSVASLANLRKLLHMPDFAP